MQRNYNLITIDMSLYQLTIFILCLTTALGAAKHARKQTTHSRTSNNTLADKGQLLANNIPTKSNMPTGNDIIIQNEHNLLGISMSLVTRLMNLRSFTLSEASWDALSRMFAAFMSLIFGPHINIMWPQFVNIAVPFLRLLTS